MPSVGADESNAPTAASPMRAIQISA